MGGRGSPFGDLALHAVNQPNHAIYVPWTQTLKSLESLAWMLSLSAVCTNMGVSENRGP